MTTQRKDKSDINICKLNEPQRINSFPLPSDMESDLTDAFRFYDKEDMGYVSMPHFKNILHNFGFQNKQAKEQQEELRKNDPEIVKRQGVCLPETKFFVGYRWNKGGKQEEAREAFKLFDKKDRDVINAGDLKAMLANYLEFPVS